MITQHKISIYSSQEKKIPGVLKPHHQVRANGLCCHIFKLNGYEISLWNITVSSLFQHLQSSQSVLILSQVPKTNTVDPSAEVGLSSYFYCRLSSYFYRRLSSYFYRTLRTPHGTVTSIRWPLSTELWWTFIYCTRTDSFGTSHCLFIYIFRMPCCCWKSFLFTMI